MSLGLSVPDFTLQNARPDRRRPSPDLSANSSRRGSVGGPAPLDAALRLKTRASSENRATPTGHARVGTSRTTSRNLAISGVSHAFSAHGRREGGHRGARASPLPCRQTGHARTERGRPRQAATMQSALPDRMATKGRR